MRGMSEGIKQYIERTIQRAEAKAASYDDAHILEKQYWYGYAQALKDLLL